MLQIILNGKRKETMADVTKKTTNKFTKGLVMDFSPENTRNEVLTHALNATLLTFNGNELSLQNDMGNARVETAYLPEGFMPVGTCEYGGIIYIVSYNPLENKSLIGCFPSPERNISRDELGEPITTPLNSSDFQEIDENKLRTGVIKNNSKYVLLKNDELHPGDKFIVTSDSSIYNNDLADLYKYDSKTSQFVLKEHPIIALNIVSIEESGKIIYLNSDIRQYEHKTNGDTYKYHILGETATNDELPFDQLAIDLDSYRNVLSSGYSVFKQKTSGKLALLAELIMIDSYSVTHSLVPNNKGGFDIVIHNDVSPTIDSKNWFVAPKLLYLYLENSLGYLQVLNNNTNSDRIELIDYPYGVLNENFLNISLKSLFTSSDTNLFKDNQTLKNTADFNFPKQGTYHGEIVPVTDTGDILSYDNVITKFRANSYHRIDISQIIPTVSGKPDYDIYLPYHVSLNAQFYNYNTSKDEYTEWQLGQLISNYTYFVYDETIEYKDAQRDTLYQNEVLYKRGSEIQVATSVQINDVTIEKYAYLDVIKYILATLDDILDTSKKKFYRDGNSYIEAKLLDDFNKTLYIQTTELNLISLGTTVSKEESQGFVYYYPETEDYIFASEEDKQTYWDFLTYPKTDEAPYGCSITLYYKKTTSKPREVTKLEILDYQEGVTKFYYRSAYNPIYDLLRYNGDLDDLSLYIKFPKDTYIPYSKFVPDTQYNWISGQPMPDKDLDGDATTDGPYLAPEENSLVLYKVSNYIPLLPTETNYTAYNDVVLASILFPEVLMNNGIDLPFKYDYTIVPCMNYGRLDHLRVSNTVDFNNLHKFDQSGFNTWKYRIDGELLRLTFGADVYDTFETDKVDGLILEFYDLWGFVGSLEISDKKSYNGVFTKILYLNSLNTLSNKKINVDLYSENYQHNINIVEKDSKFYLNDKEVQYTSYDSGWRYNDKDSSDLETNDVGTLYPNLIYGVKTYLRKTSNKGTLNETTLFIPKLEFFLYTLPIFNDYYYTTNNFNSIVNPKLDFVLTYKLTDKSTKSNYLGELVTNGYYDSDKSNIDLYLQGNYKPNDLLAIKYYKYEGTSKLQLEIGLKQELTDLGLNYNPSINELFECTLELKNSDNEIYTINSDDGSIIDSNLILNYYNSGNQVINLDLNYMLFDNSSSSYSILSDSSNPFNSYNFLYNTGTQAININYEFIVGYQVNINKIRETLIPATTVCALFHKNTDGEYNYKDFGIHKSSLLDPVYYANDNTIWGNYAKATSDITPQSDETCALLYDTIFYNSGDTEYERFGLCQQLKYQNLHYADDLADYLNLTEEVRPFLEIVTPAQSRYSGGILNSYAMKDIKNNIGKLAFCLPHIHTIDDNYGVSIEFGSPVIDDSSYESKTPRKLFMRDPTTDNRLTDDGKLVPGHDSEHEDKGHLAIWPHFNLSAITKELMELESQFISAIDYDTCYDGWPANDGIKVRTYTGFTGKQLAIFNRKMLETMKSVYAYNPDYDFMTVNLGDVSVQNYNPYITSNIISSNSNINFSNTNKTLNDYIYIGTILISSYLQYLNKYSKNENNIGITIEKTKSKDEPEDKFEFIPLLQFIPGFTYCGTQDNPYLISSLTYNLPVPSDLESELEFSLSDNIIVKDSEGYNYFLKGTPNKKMLYYYDHDINKLIELDVANYTIAENGSLIFKNININKTATSSINIDSEFSLNGSNYNITKPILFTFDDASLNLDTSVTFSVKPSASSGCKVVKYDNKTFYIYAYDYTTKKSRLKLFTDVNISTLSNNLVKYTFANNSIKIKECVGRTINRDLISSTVLENMSVTLLDLLFSDDFNQNITINDVSYKLSQLLNHTNINDYTIQIPDPTSYSNGDYKTWNNLTDKDLTNQIAGQMFTFKTKKEVQYYASIYKITIDSANINATSSSVLTSLSSNIITFPKTLNYHKIVSNKYTVTLENVSFRGSSITLNDLVYDYQMEHRLFLNATRYSYDDKPNGKLYYRTYNRSGGGPSKTVKEYHLDTLPKNRLFLYTGPCYTENNL